MSNANIISYSISGVHPKFKNPWTLLDIRSYSHNKPPHHTSIQVQRVLLTTACQPGDEKKGESTTYEPLDVCVKFAFSFLFHFRL